MEQNEQDRKKLPSYNARDETQNKKYKCKERRVDGRSRWRGGVTMTSVGAPHWLWRHGVNTRLANSG